MKILIVYDSLFGNTQKVAETLATALVSHQVSLKRAPDAGAGHARDADVLFVGSPTHGGRPSEATKRFLSSLDVESLNGKPVCAFDTGIPAQGQGFLIRFVVGVFGYASKRIATSLAQKGARVVASETFYVLGKEGPLKEGELERARDWAKRCLL
jgi:flavodoxin